MQTTKKPSYRVMAPREVKDKTFWTPVGVGFENAAKEVGQRPSITVQLDAMPLGGKVVLFPNDGDPEENAMSRVLKVEDIEAACQVRPLYADVDGALICVGEAERDLAGTVTIRLRGYLVPAGVSVEVQVHAGVRS